jgi:hypothetical protein
MNKKGQVVNKIVILVIALIVIAIMAFLAYKYVLGTGQQIGEFTSCKAQGPGSDCVATASECTDGRLVYGLGCPPKTSAGKISTGYTKDHVYCCVKGQPS